ncbi:MAG: SLC13 family permease [Dehalococcoidales bacterium]|jgi:Na+/H+ antiporter NhaD/arsenite permease-like protein
MENIQLIALVIFLITVGLIIWGKVERSVIGIIGVAVMVFAEVMTETEAFLFVDWNIIAILYSVWILAAYFGRTGMPEYLSVVMLKASRNNIALFLVLMGVLAALLSMFVDNVVVILLMAPVVLNITRKLKLPSFPFLIWIGLSANFMGTALLLGDLPPQMLHSVAGIEFSEFIWQMGRPSSFIILTITFLITACLFYQFKFRKMFSGSTIDINILTEIANTNQGGHIKNKKFAVVVISVFLATIIAMALRQYTGLLLGFIALIGMVTLVLISEIFRKNLRSPDLEDVLNEIDMRTLFFYIVLFALVGGINHTGIISMISGAMAHYLQNDQILGPTILYWVTAPIVGIVEHDAYILAFLYLVRDLAQSTGINPWPLWWAILWAGTLGSNLTVVGAPALLVSQNICEKEESCRVDLKQFFSYTVPFVLTTLIICFILMLFIWIIPLAN